MHWFKLEYTINTWNNDINTVQTSYCWSLSFNNRSIMPRKEGNDQNKK